MNTIDAAELTYPDKPDKNGYAKRYYKRRAFYFGLHNTPESFMLFGEWKRQLMESGVAPEVKMVRKDLAHQMASAEEENPPKLRRWHAWPYVSILCALIIGGTMLGSVNILSSNVRPSVDGVTLTDDEIEYVRGIRKHSKQHSPLDFEQMAELTLRLMEEGPTNVGIHKRSGT